MDTKQKILTKAKYLFAQQGYAGVSIRNLAKSVDMSTAALYHYFPDKKSLYLETVLFSFADKADTFAQVWQSEQTAELKLQRFIASHVQLVLEDQDFNRLLQREMLEADSGRMKLLAEKVFQEQFMALMTLIQQLAPSMDAHLGAISVISLVCKHIEMQPLRNYLPNWRPEHEQAEVIAKHVTDLLLHGLG